MANKEDLKEVFVSGATPSEQDFHDLIDVAGERGPAGADGNDGADGAKGSDGTAGSDGFGTEEQYDDIIARLEALENVE